MKESKQIAWCRNAQAAHLRDAEQRNGKSMILQRIFILIVLALSSITAFGQTFYMYGSRSVCPTANPIENYSFSPTSGCPIATGPFSSTYWSVSGGIFVTSSGTPINPNTGIATSVYVKWTTPSGSSAGSVSVSYTYGSCSSGGSISVAYAAPAGVLPSIPTLDISSGDICPGSAVTLSANNLNTSYDYVWSYSEDNGSTWSPLTTTSTNTTTFANNFTTFPSGYRELKFRVLARYAACPMIVAPGYGISGPVRFYPPAPTADITAINRVCATSGSITVKNIVSASNEVVVNIKASDGNVVAGSDLNGDFSKSDKSFNLSDDTYTVQIQPRGAIGCSLNSSSKVVGVQQAVNSLTVSATPTSPLCNNGNGSILASASNTTGAVSFSLNNGVYNAANPNPITGVAPNTYTVYAIDVNGCRGNATTTINNPPAVNVPTASVTSGLLPNHNGRDISCVGAADGRITVSASGGTGALQYSINNGSTYLANGGVFSSLSAGTYDIKVRDSNGCERAAASSIVVTNPPALIPGTASGTNPLCNLSSGSITVTGSGGGTGTLQYSRDGVSAFQTTNVIANVPAGTYNTITIKDANGCTAVVPSAVTLTPPPAIGVVSSITQPTCFGSSNGQITVTASNAVGTPQYSRDGGTTFQSANVFNTVGAGSYSIVVKDANGCLSPTNTTIVGQPSSVTGGIAIPPAFACFNTNNSTTLDLTPAGGIAPYAFSWSTGSTTEDAVITMGNALSTTYSVNITDSQGCTTSRTITVTQPSTLISTIVPTHISCFGANNGTIDLAPSGGTVPYSFVWNTGAITEDLNARPPGSYSVTITDAKGCTTTASTTLTQPTAFTLTQGAITPALCHGQSNGSVNLIAAGGTGTYEFSANAVTWQTNSLITGLSASASPKTLYGRDQKGCSAQIAVTITEPSVLSVSTADITAATCGLSNGSATSSGSGGTSPYSYVWQNSSNATISTVSALTGVPGGSYRITITDKNGCTDYEDIAISSPNGPQVTIDAVTSTRCWDTNDGRAIITVTSGQTPYKEIKWNNGEVGLQPMSLSPGTGVNIVTVTDASDCVAAFAVDVPSPTPLEVSAAITQATCPGGSDGMIIASVQGGTGAYTYAWSTGATGSTLSNLSAGNYQVTVNDANNCSSLLPVQLIDKPAIAIDATATAPSCQGKADGGIVVMATGGNGAFTYTWDTGASGANLTNIGAGTYTVTAIDGQSCELQKQIVLVDPAPLQIDLGPDIKICVGGTLKVASPVPSPTYSWASSNGFISDQKEVTLTEAGTYTLRVTNALGCIAEDSFTLTTATDLLKADFLMVPEAYEGDTVIVIDISWPLPEGITWRLPSESRVVNRTSDYVEMIFDKSGEYDVEMDASISSCQDSHSQRINILAGSRPTIGGRSGERLIIDVRLHPNPNAGDFAVNVELSRESPVEMAFVNLEGNTLFVIHGESARESYHWPMHLPQLSPGVYFVFVRAGKETRMVRMVKL